MTDFVHQKESTNDDFTSKENEIKESGLTTKKPSGVEEIDQMQDKNQDGTIKHILAYDYIKMRNKKSSSIVHRKLAKEITECLGSSTEEYAAEYLKSLSKVMGACIRELSDLEKFESL